MGTLGSTRAMLKPYRRMDGEIFHSKAPAFKVKVLKDILYVQKGKPRLVGRKRLPESPGDPTSTEEALEELYFEHHKGRISYVIGWILMFHIKRRPGGAVVSIVASQPEDPRLPFLPRWLGHMVQQSPELSISKNNEHVVDYNASRADVASNI